MNALPQAQFNHVMSRLQEAVGAASSAELGRMLGLTTSAYANRKKSGSIPYEAMADLARAKGISLDWLMHGEGPKEAPWSLARATETRLCAAFRDGSPYAAQMFGMATRIAEKGSERLDRVAFVALSLVELGLGDAP